MMPVKDRHWMTLVGRPMPINGYSYEQVGLRMRYEVHNELHRLLLILEQQQQRVKLISSASGMKMQKDRGRTSAMMKATWKTMNQ